jgi:drug/metabolite transporter (DMT)-like permease
MKADGERLALAAFLVGTLFAGGNAVAVRFSNRELDPLWGAGLRFSLAAALLVGIMVVMRLERPRGRALTGALLYGAFTFAGAFALAYYALVRLHAGFGQTLLALVPLATLVVAVAQRQERLRTAAALGAFLALVGVAVMSRAPLREDIPVLSVLAGVGSAFCFAQGAVLVRRFPPIHPVAMNAVGMSAGAGLLVVGSTLIGERIELPQRPATWAAVCYLVAVGSVVVFVLYLVVLGRWTASRASYQFVLIPFVTVALSAWLDDEPIGVTLVLGGFLVLVGVYVGALRPGRPGPDPDRVAPLDETLGN